MGMRMREVRSPMIMTRLPEPLLSAAEVTGGFSAVRTAVGPEGPRMSLACLGLRLLLGICTQSNKLPRLSALKVSVNALEFVVAVRGGHWTSGAHFKVSIYGACQ